ncbi:hypothetical protein [Sphingobium cupriresistens]|uniref:hypothetical protein n=1 Tax=Sphingobium cupriresistens TaxID=1132417 RepID=UPI001A923363
MGAFRSGLALAFVAVMLAREAKGLLIGESVDPALIEQMWRAIERRPEIMAVNPVKPSTPRPTPSSSRSAPISRMR